MVSKFYYNKEMLNETFKATKKDAIRRVDA